MDEKELVEFEELAKRNRKGSFLGSKMKFSKDETWEEAKKKWEHFGEPPWTSNEWRNRRPICPYGCDEEGTLMEVIMKDGKALGIYTHSESIRPFYAELQMAPKPTGRKLQIGPDGNYEMVEENGK